MQHWPTCKIVFYVEKYSVFPKKLDDQRMKNFDFDSDAWIRRSRDSSNNIHAELKEKLKELVRGGGETPIFRL